MLLIPEYCSSLNLLNNIPDADIKQQKEVDHPKMVPVDRTLEKECFIYRYFFIYLNFKIWGLGDNMSKITFSTKEIKILQKNPNVQRVSELSYYIY